MSTDDELLAAYDDGDELAFNELVRRHVSSVYTFALRLTGNEQNAEDIAQITFVKAWLNLGKFLRGSSFRTWLLAIARNASIDLLRKKHEIPITLMQSDESESSFEENLPDMEPLPDEITASAREKETMQTLLKELPLVQREVLLLYYQEHLTFAEISQTTGISINTIKSRHFRALRELRKRLI